MKQPREVITIDGVTPEFEEQMRMRARQLGLTLEQYLENILRLEYCRNNLGTIPENN